MVDLDELGPSELKRISNAPKEFLDKVRSVNSKRARFVVNEILEFGFCTTKRIQEAGYDHPPRAARDVKECGIELITERYSDPSANRPLGVYIFGDFNANPMSSKTSGRQVLSDSLKDQLINKYGSKCFIYLEELPKTKLQVDHRIPYEIAGEQDTSNIDNFMLLSASANRRKSWECENCPNWVDKSTSVCELCFWAHPESYSHIACMEGRQIFFRLDNNAATVEYDGLVKERGADWVSDKLKSTIEYYLVHFDSLGSD